MYADWDPPHFSLVVCYIVHLLIPLLCKTWFYKDCNIICKHPVLDVIRTLGTSIHSGHYTTSINCCKKHSIATITQSWSLELLTAKTPLPHILYYMNWLTHDFWTRTGAWEFDRSHGAGTSSLSHWRGTGAETCGLDDVFPPDDLCSRPEALYIYIYIYIYICSSIWVLFWLAYQLCLALGW